MEKSIYLKQQLSEHIKLHFTEPAVVFYEKTEIVFARYTEILSMRGDIIAIPIDIKENNNLNDISHVSFNGTTVTLWNHICLPDTKDWESIPNDNNPLWFRHKSGVIILSWDIYKNLLNLLLCNEELINKKRDIHDRFPSDLSLNEGSFLKVPAFNEAAAILIAAAWSLQNKGIYRDDIQCYIRKPLLVLSHDCDVLKGDDFWTQSIRLYRVVEPLRKAQIPKLKNIWWFCRNYIYPEDFYLNNCSAMVELEYMYGFTSTFYFLNGEGGRFGARTEISSIIKALNVIPDSWSVGMHYNYNTFLDGSEFAKQKESLEKICKKNIISGRAHYLRFDITSSPLFLSRMGIKIDESLGFPDRIGFRAGIAGIFNPFDVSKSEVIEIKLLPLMIMDSALIGEYTETWIQEFESMLEHVTRVGGMISLLIHPGWFYNPEFPEAMYVYARLLAIAKRLGYISRNAESFC